MFVFAFDEVLFELKAKRPSPEPLFQLPPRIRTRQLRRAANPYKIILC